MPGSIDHAGFIALLTEQFPDVVASVDDCSQGLLHLEMATLARATQAALDRDDKETVRLHFMFVDRVFCDAAADVENAVYVSYLENLQFEGRRAGLTNARALLSTRLTQALAELEAHLTRIFGSAEREPAPKQSEIARHDRRRNPMHRPRRRKE